MRSVVFGDQTHDQSDNRSGEVAEIDPKPRIRCSRNLETCGQRPPSHDEHHGSAENGGDDQQPLEGRGHFLIAVGTSEENEREQADRNAHRRDQDRIEQRVQIGCKGHRTNHKCRTGAFCTRTKKVCAHACDIPHIVPHIIRNHGGVARIIFWNALFDLAHKVGPHVSSLGENTTAHTGKERD